MSADMTPQKAAELRKPFPDSVIGKLPKPYKSDSPKGTCNECGGWHGLPAAHLDFVGHAATTDRLLAVDPEWSWEPLAYTDAGLPCLDNSANLWIKLTVCGVTRIGVGDGKNAKECIGDAIRNAAMRFGVALDLWSKNDLEQVTIDAPKLKAALHSTPDEPVTTRRMSRPKTPAAVDPGDGNALGGAGLAPGPSSGDVLLDIESGLAKLMFKRFGQVGLGRDDQRNARLAYVNSVIAPREIASSKEMTDNEARAVIKELEAVLEAQPPLVPDGAA